MTAAPHRPTSSPASPPASSADRTASTPDGFDPAAVVVRKRDGRPAPFDVDRIQRAIEMAFRASYQIPSPDALGERVLLQVERITAEVAGEVGLAFESRGAAEVDVEQVQDWVETHLMQAGEFRVARDYIVYREERSRARAVRGSEAKPEKALKVKKADGSTAPLDVHAVKRRVFEACLGLDEVRPDELLQDVLVSLYDGIAEAEVDKALIMVARSRIEREPAYNQAAVRLLLGVVYRESLGETLPPPNYGAPAPLFEGSDEVQAKEHDSFASAYRAGLRGYLQAGVDADLLDAELLSYDLDRIAGALEPERDRDFQYLGLQTVYDRYLIHIEGRRIGTPQFFWMRVAMGLALREDNREERAIEFYQLLSTFRFVSATPTLFNAGTKHPQLSSCYLSTVDDDLTHIFKVIGDNAALSKWAGGLGNDWTNVRATGSYIRGTNGASQGVIPFLKIVNDTAHRGEPGRQAQGRGVRLPRDLAPRHRGIPRAAQEHRRRPPAHPRHAHRQLDSRPVHEAPVAANGEPWTLFSPQRRARPARPVRPSLRRALPRSTSG